MLLGGGGWVTQDPHRDLGQEQMVVSWPRGRSHESKTQDRSSQPKPPNPSLDGAGSLRARACAQCQPVPLHCSGEDSECPYQGPSQQPHRRPAAVALKSTGWSPLQRGTACHPWASSEQPKVSTCRGLKTLSARMGDAVFRDGDFLIMGHRSLPNLLRLRTHPCHPCYPSRADCTWAARLGLTRCPLSHTVRSHTLPRASGSDSSELGQQPGHPAGSAQCGCSAGKHRHRQEEMTMERGQSFPD